jgi:uncharacterized iron-regulated protein
MEMLDVSASDAIAACNEAHCTPAELAQAVGWDRSGWPDWHIYEPALRAALGVGLAIAPASLPREEVQEFARTGALRGGDHELWLLGLDQPLAQAARDAMAADIRRSHCGFAPEEMIDGMVGAQRLRDAHMAESMVMAAPLGRAVLIAGAEHVRRDRAVPQRLAVLAPDDVVASLAFVEVDDDLANAASYAEEFASERLPFDFVWFTPRFDDQDPCERFRSELQKLRH